MIEHRCPTCNSALVWDTKIMVNDPGAVPELKCLNCANVALKAERGELKAENEKLRGVIGAMKQEIMRSGFCSAEDSAFITFKFDYDLKSTIRGKTLKNIIKP